MARNPMTFPRPKGINPDLPKVPIPVPELVRVPRPIGGGPRPVKLGGGFGGPGLSLRKAPTTGAFADFLSANKGLSVRQKRSALSLYQTGGKVPSLGAVDKQVKVFRKARKAAPGFKPKKK